MTIAKQEKKAPTSTAITAPGLTSWPGEVAAAREAAVVGGAAGAEASTSATTRKPLSALRLPGVLR